ncbi:MAG TPA: alpha/beta fold hydrolase [Solirubrobacteraceae bacterium]|nr:alpha/beta fold hydrolase [Solirubrobacteraceae bacterium]
MALLSVLLLTGLPASSAGSPGTSLSFTPCAHEASFACTTVTVPLDHAGTVPGTIGLSVERLQAGLTPSASAVLALAGGPGQAADPLAGFMAKAIAPALRGRDLIVYDQRGTGRSDPLNCHNSPALEKAHTEAQEVEQCALQLGPARGAFTSEESVQDIEAIREALGYEKLVLYGTSYGTKVALEYAERYPEHVEALVLDSVVLPEGPEPFSLSSIQALAPVLAELCSEGACTQITSNPLGDIATLAARLRRHALSGSVYDGSGHRHSATMGEADLFNVLLAGDLNPALRALLPAAVQSALQGNPDPLLRLKALSEGLIPNVPLQPRGSSAEREANEEEDNALFLATSCEEKPFPWQRSAAPATREAEARAALHGLPSGDLYPFDAATVWSDSLVPVCLDWPNASPAPPAAGPLPNVPTLILSGEQDLRTPTAGARRIAAEIPDAQLLVVPYTGHSVIGSDFGDCAALAVEAFFVGGVGGQLIQPCKPEPNPFGPTPITPTRLAHVQPVPGLGGNRGRTLTAVLDTIVDLERQLIGATLQVQQKLPNGSSFGGLHGGYAKLSASAVRLHDLTFVPGVALSGTLPTKEGRLQSITIHVSGSAATHGTVTLGAGGRASGILAGQRFTVSTAKAQLSRAGAIVREWGAVGSALRLRFPLPALVRMSSKTSPEHFTK